ncbi:MAG: YdcF family protein, partial [Pseudomonadota bacterium]
MRFGRWISLALFIAAAVAAVAEWSLYRAIRRDAGRDEAQPAGAIVVFGAAQYDGAPSPVFQARLDHAFDLEERGLAPLIITTGAGGGDQRYTEAGVGRDYLIQRGVAASKISTDPLSNTTVASVRATSAILKSRRITTCIASSDGFHLYRIKLLFRSEGITAYASPTPNSPIEAESYLRTLYSLREMLSSSLWY